VIPRPNDRIRLDTSVLDTLFHSPAVLARRLAKLDRLSGGRRLIGLGQGWMTQEFTAAGIPPARRGAGFAAAHDMALLTQRLQQKGVEPGGANGFHPQVHFRVTPPDPATPSLLASHPPTTGRKGLGPGERRVAGTLRGGMNVDANGGRAVDRRPLGSGEIPPPVAGRVGEVGSLVLSG
jgi:alkanesulfonate monooxygenase SsuD/methylene tetrahydromethanopterin reductase-like flavin-dependent oxidoreductase (luciferase family)